MSEYLPIIDLILVIWAIGDCVQKRHSYAWIFVVIVFPIFGPLLYFAFTRNWFGQISWAMVTGRPRAGDNEDVVGEGTPAALQKMGIVLARRERYNEAIGVFEQLLAHEGPSVPPEARFEIAMAYKAVGRYRDARDQLSLILGDDPKFHVGEGMLELADCYDQMKDEAQALRLLEQLLRLVRFPEARYKYGLLLDRAGRAAEAAEQMSLLLNELDSAPDFHRKNNKRYAKLAKEFLQKKKDEG
jgi:hypothetical protein